MAIDYNRRPKKEQAPEPVVPASSAPPASGPSWYIPPSETETATPAAGWPPPVAPAQHQRTASLAAGAASGSVSLRKVSLTSASPVVSLSKSGGHTGVIRVNLNWSAGQAPLPSGQKGGGFFKRLAAMAAPTGGIDLDLGCLYELTDGTKGVVQALGNSFGALDRPPYILLDGDDRSGAVSAGETMSINLQPGRFRRILIFALIYEGTPNWASVDGVVTLSPIEGPQIEVRLDATDQSARICAVAQLIDSGGDLVVQREVRYINGGQQKLDNAFGWGMNWTPGRK